MVNERLSLRSFHLAVDKHGQREQKIVRVFIGPHSHTDFNPPRQGSLGDLIMDENWLASVGQHPWPTTYTMSPTHVNDIWYVVRVPHQGVNEETAMREVIVSDPYFGYDTPEARMHWRNLRLPQLLSYGLTEEQAEVVMSRESILPERREFVRNEVQGLDFACFSVGEDGQVSQFFHPLETDCCVTSDHLFT